MQIKRFEAKDMTAALAQIKKEFGPEAVILSAKSVKKPGGLLGIPKDAGVVVTAAIDPSRVPDVKKMSLRQKNDPSGPAQPDLRLQDGKGGLLNSLQSGIGVLKKKGTAMKRQRNAHPDHRPAAGLRGFLRRQGVEEQIAAELVKRMPVAGIGLESLDQESAALALTGALEQMGAKAGPVKVAPTGQTVVALVGPTGVGKTTVVAKLAAAQAIDMGRRVGVITLDCQRIGAVEQMRIFTDIIGVPMEAASDVKSFSGALQRLGSCELVLVDTRGAGYHQADILSELQTMFKTCPALSIQLVLSAGTQSADLDATVRLFKPLGVDGLLFTKLDECTCCGNLINQLVKTAIPVSYISDGQQIPEDLFPATIRRLADLCIRPLNRDAARPQKNTVREAAPAATLLDRRRQTTAVEPKRVAEAPAVSAAAYVANINSDIFHLHDCKWTKRIKPGNMIEFNGIDDALKKGFNPCRYCRPKQAGQARRPAYRPGVARKIAGYR
jgi:flagellar biosynthesis protein FlhF